MTYNWSVVVNGQHYTVQAMQSRTAVYRALDKKDIEGTITFKRLSNIKRVKCPDCGLTYQDNPESKREHYENNYYHKGVMEKKGWETSTA